MPGWLRNPFAFLRGTFYRWLQRWRKECGHLHNRHEDVLVAVGDLHIENFGIWRDCRNRLVWGINDFDEACQVPFTLDLVGSPQAPFLPPRQWQARSRGTKSATSCWRVCQVGLEEAGAPILLDAGDRGELLAFVSCVTELPSTYWAEKFNDDDNPEISSKELPRGLEDAFRPAFPRGKHAGLPQATKTGWTWQFWTPALHGRPQTRRQRLLRSRGQSACPSTLSWLEMRPAAISLAGTLLQRIVRSPDPCLQVHDRWLVRQAAPQAIKVGLPASKEDSRLAFASVLLSAMGFETANAHLGSRSPGELQTAMDGLRRELGDDWVGNGGGENGKGDTQGSPSLVKILEAPFSKVRWPLIGIWARRLGPEANFHARRAPFDSLNLVPLLSVKMAHPSALDADGVARVIVFSHKGPPKLTAPAPTAPAGALS